jgi:hypothetical protein
MEEALFLEQTLLLMFKLEADLFRDTEVWPCLSSGNQEY